MIGINELTNQIAENTGVAKKDIKTVLDAFWKTVTVNVELGEEVRFIGYGKFYKKHTNARTGRNPQTGAAIEIAETNKLGFKSQLKFD